MVQGGCLLEYCHPPRYTPRLEEVHVEAPQVPLTEVEEEMFNNIL